MAESVSRAVWGYYFFRGLPRRVLRTHLLRPDAEGKPLLHRAAQRENWAISTRNAFRGRPLDQGPKVSRGPEGCETRVGLA